LSKLIFSVISRKELTQQSLKPNHNEFYVNLHTYQGVPQARREKKSRTVEDALYIHVEHVIPSLFLREVKEGPAPGDARVVNQDVDLVFTLPELRDEGVAPGF